MHSRRTTSGLPATSELRTSGASILQPANRSPQLQAAWNTARDTAKVFCRFYDARHAFITRLAENPAVSEETIRQFAGRVNPRMLSRYAHVRAQAHRDAIATLEASPATERVNFEAGSPQSRHNRRPRENRF